QEGLPWVPANVLLSPLNTLPASNPFGPVGETRLSAVPETRVILPARGDQPSLALYLAEILDLENNPWPACPRGLLRAALAKLEDQFGLVIKVGFEHECYIRGIQDVPTPAFSLAGTRMASGLAEEVQQILSSANTRLDQFVAEFGENQFEISSPVADALSAADHAVLAREVIRDAARARGWSPTFAAKPYPKQPGSGVHIHLSLWTSTGEPVTASNETLTGSAAAFLAGILRDLTSIMAFTTPSANSFSRLTPSSWVGVFNCYGKRNREAAVRFCPRPPAPDGSNPGASLEFRVADGGCNPYLALAALVNAGMAGVRDQLAAPESIETDPAGLTEAERAARAIHPVAADLPSVMAEIEKNGTVERWFGPVFQSAYLAVLKNAIADADSAGADYAARYSRAI
ncbi:MAG: glutamine synthetase family protein, partial [Pseudomonadota bacterium]